jgi:predicted GNAT family N-acyltransferase
VNREVRLAGPRDMPAVYALRHEVFVIGQDVPADLERDELDDIVDHGVAFVDGVVVGTGRLLPPDRPDEPGKAATIGRMAVAGAERGRGTGAAVLALLEETARTRGWPVVELHAQVHAEAFYRRAGYAAYGEVYLEAGIEHVSMRKVLPDGLNPPPA